MPRSFNRRFLAVLLPVSLGLAACSEDTPPLATMAMVHSSQAHDFTVEPISRSGFPDNIDATFRIKLSTATNVVHVTELSDVVVAKVTILPGGSLGWHTHHGPAIASVASGELSIINATDCVKRGYPAGKAFVDPGQGNVHIGFNEGTTAAVVFVTFLDVPAGQGATIPAQDPGCQ